MTPTNYTFEVCANSVESAIATQEGGAQRVELCASMPEGGVTPSIGAIQQARQHLHIALHPIIRPRGGDFVYSPLEISIMEDDIRRCKDAGADGVVFGALLPDGELDLPAMERLMRVAEGLSVTCHRAFDYAARPLIALQQLMDLGVHRLLTSGQQPTALVGIPLLRTLVAQAEGRITIMPGCGITAENIAQIARETHATEFHFSARESRQSTMQFRNPALYMGTSPDTDEYLQSVTTPAKVRATIDALQGAVD